MSEVVALDSSGWMEYFADTDRADLFAATIETVAAAPSLIQRGRVVEIDLSLALEAAVLGLPMADSLIFASARRYGAARWTPDAHFDGLPGVNYFAKP